MIINEGCIKLFPNPHLPFSREINPEKNFWKILLLDILVTSDLHRFNKVFKNKEIEFEEANYTPHAENDADIFHSKFKYL